MTRDTIGGRRLNECISEGNCLSSEMFQLYIFLSCLHIIYALFTCFVYSGNQVNAVTAFCVLV